MSIFLKLSTFLIQYSIYNQCLYILLNMLKDTFYSRQIATYGIEMMNNWSKKRILVHGLQGIGVEACKNIILSGPFSLTLHDDGYITEGDAEVSYCYSNKDLGTKRIAVCFDELSELNSNVRITKLEDSLNEEVIKNHDLVLVTDSKDIDMIQINKICRNNQIGFIFCETIGLVGTLFVDFGNEFECLDPIGIDYPEIGIGSVLNKENPIIIVEETGHKLSKGDFITFKDVYGMKELNYLPPQKVDVIDKTSFSIDVDTTEYGKFVSGRIKKVVYPKTYSFISWENFLKNPKFDYPPDASKIQRQFTIHTVLLALRKFHQKYSNYVNPIEDTEIEECLKIAKKTFEDYKSQEMYSNEEFDEEIAIKCIKVSNYQLVPLASFWGALAAQECLKICKKYTPLQNCLYIDFLELSGKNIIPCLTNQSSIIGSYANEKLSNLKVFIIGAGALGCEYLKLLALMNIGTIYITDDDKIEISNLNRQFWFRNQDVGKNKSIVAAEAARLMKTNSKIISYSTRVTKANNTIFNDDFFEGISLIINAVDNVEARKFIDQLCIFYSKPLFDSGTEGIKASSQIILPGKTCTYSDNIPPSREVVPFCTIRTFPYKKEHCIEWAKNEFDFLFNILPKLYNQNIEDYTSFQKYYSKLIENELTSFIMTFTEFSVACDTRTVESCINFAFYANINYFNTKISFLQENSPQDSLDENGISVWAPPKRFPRVIEEINQDFIITVTKLLMKILNIEYQEVVIPEGFARQELQYPDEIVQLAKKNSVECLHFEKDDNSHIDFIHSASLMRAKNYYISEFDREYSRKIAGNMIPAVSTTTSAITAACALELYKLVLTENVDDYRNLSMDLSEPFLRYSIPRESNIFVSNDQYISIPSSITVWDKVCFSNATKVLDIRDFFEFKYKMNISCIMKEDGSVIYDTLLLSPEENKLNREVNSYKEYEGQKWIKLLVTGSKNKKQVKLPSIKVSFI